MSSLKRLKTKHDTVMEIQFPLSNEELKKRWNLYDQKTPRSFATEFRTTLFEPIETKLDDMVHQIQFNFCLNPFCKWYGLPQEKFNNVKSKPSRYKLDGNGDRRQLICNPDPYQSRGKVFGNKSAIISNWSVTEEIERLLRINSVEDINPDYNFHKDGCTNSDLTPFDSPSNFYTRGNSSSNSKKYQCKSCKKITHVLPSRRQSFTYGQKKNGVLHTFAKLLINRVPINGACDILGIGKGTYYKKLELLYLRCLEFLERHEAKAFKNQEFREVWINSDRMIYNLNNNKRKGKKLPKLSDIDEKNLQTSIMISSDVLSRYVFRSDIAYDWDVNSEDIESDTEELKEDHLNIFSRKNARFNQFSYYPQEPSKSDTQTEQEYLKEIHDFNKRLKYVKGFHVNASYTNTAHFWLIKQMLNTDEWRFVTDDDASIINSMHRVFSQEFRLSDAHHFLCLTDKTKSRTKAEQEFEEAKDILMQYKDSVDAKTNNLRKLAEMKLTDIFESHSFHHEVYDGEMIYKEHAGDPIEHPLATPDRGFREVDCTTDLSALEPKEIASLIINVNDNATNSFIQNIRRGLSVLERPLTTARSDVKSYIYANFNPRYAQYALTILRTYYNFCKPYKVSRTKKMTPAQKLGITDKEFSWEDIIYFK